MTPAQAAAERCIRAACSRREPGERRCLSRTRASTAARLVFPQSVLGLGEHLLDRVGTGTSGGRNRCSVPLSLIALRTASLSWQFKLSMTSMSPG